MRSASDSEWRLQGLSLYEITSKYEAIINSLAPKYKLDGRRLKPGPALNALVIAFIRMDAAEQERIIVEGIKEYERLRSLETPGDVAAPGPRQVGLDVRHAKSNGRAAGNGRKGRTPGEGKNGG